MPEDSTANGITRRDQALAHLRHLIASGELAPGERIVERDIAQRYDMSRGPVREAIRALEHEGLVEWRPYAGVSVARIDRDDIEELIALRKQVEYFSIARAALRAKAEDIERLRECADEMERVYERQDVMRFMELDFDFHLTICVVSGHAILGQMLKTLMPRLMMLWYPDLKERNDTPESLKLDHYALIEPIERRDVSAGLAAIDRHIDGFYTALTLRYERAPSLAGSGKAFRPVRPVAVERHFGS